MSQIAQYLKTCLFALPLIVAFSTQSASQSAKVFKAGAPRPTVLPGFQLAHCIQRPGRLRICKGISDTDSLLFIEKAGKTVVSWPVQLYVGETSDFEVLQADLDRDGRRELILANHDGTSNGIAVNTWTIYVFPDSEFSRPQAPLIFSVEEYGALGTFVSEGNTIFILTTRWVWSKDPQGRRRNGLYLVGQWWRYRSGELVPVTEKPLLTRRYLASFAAERGRTYRDQRAPYLWLKSRRVHALKKNPLTGAQENEVKHGVLESVSATPFTASATTVKIVFKPERGDPFTLEYFSDDYREGEDTLEHIGDALSGRIYPDRYFPATREKWLSGKRARLVTYGEGAQFEGLKVLWLNPKLKLR
jgi:hypothetical protein